MNAPIASPLSLLRAQDEAPSRLRPDQIDLWAGWQARIAAVIGTAHNKARLGKLAAVCAHVLENASQFQADWEAEEWRYAIEGELRAAERPCAAVFGSYRK